MLVDIELCHIYLRDFMSKRSLTKSDLVSIDRAKRRADAHVADGHRIKFSVMIDDEEGDLFSNEAAAEVGHLISSHGIETDILVFESSLSAYADVLLETVRENALFEERESVFLNISSEDRLLWAEENLQRAKTIKQIFLETVMSGKDPTELSYKNPHASRFWIPLQSGRGETEREHSCSLLTATWYLHRLGVSGFGNEGAERPNLLLNILPIKYLKTEGAAIDILNLSRATRVRKARKKIEYVFI